QKCKELKHYQESEKAASPGAPLRPSLGPQPAPLQMKLIGVSHLCDCGGSDPGFPAGHQGLLLILNLNKKCDISQHKVLAVSVCPQSLPYFAAKFCLSVINASRRLCLTSTCPGWVPYLEHVLGHPIAPPDLYTTKSPQQIIGSLVKDYFTRQPSKKIFPQLQMVPGVLTDCILTSNQGWACRQGATVSEGVDADIPVQPSRPAPTCRSYTRSG
uniref:Iron hydrogenase large subunit C-terminal domain-containing protein n=1 Tax=Ursus maritimus TaxID=29073 RepID=A0A452T893_URSMA